MDRESFMRDYWTYYLMLEEKFIQTTNYVTLAEDNYSTYSNEYAALMQTIGAELDSFFKVYCLYDLSKYNKMAEQNLNKKPNIVTYCACLLDTYPDIVKQEVEIKSAGIRFCPFGKWNPSVLAKEQKPLMWWKSFTNIKHNRLKKRKCANQQNTLFILGALYLLEMKYLKNITEGTHIPDVPDKLSALFNLPGWDSRFENLNCLMAENMGIAEGIPFNNL